MIIEDELRKIFIDCGFTIDSHKVLGETYYKFMLSKKNTLNDEMRIYEVLFKNDVESFYELCTINTLNIKNDLLIPSLTINIEGMVNHTVSSFNIPSNKVLDSLECQVNMTNIAVEMTKFIKTKFIKP